MESNTVRVKYLAQEHTDQWCRPGLKHVPLDLESCKLTIIWAMTKCKIMSSLYPMLRRCEMHFYIILIIVIDKKRRLKWRWDHHSCHSKTRSSMYLFLQLFTGPLWSNRKSPVAINFPCLFFLFSSDSMII